MPKKVNVVLNRNLLENDLALILKTLPRTVTNKSMRERFWRTGATYYKLITNYINKNGLTNDFKRIYPMLAVDEYIMETGSNDKATDMALSVMIWFFQNNNVPSNFTPSLIYCQQMQEHIDLNNKVYLLHFIMDAPIKAILELISEGEFKTLAISSRQLKKIQNRRYREGVGGKINAKWLSENLEKQIVIYANNEIEQDKTQKDIAQDLGISSKYLRNIRKSVDKVEQEYDYVQLLNEYEKEHENYDYPNIEYLSAFKYDYYFEDDDTIALFQRIIVNLRKAGYSVSEKDTLYFDNKRQAYGLYKTLTNIYTGITGITGKTVPEKDRKVFLENFFGELK